MEIRVSRSVRFTTALPSLFFLTRGIPSMGFPRRESAMYRVCVQRPVRAGEPFQDHGEQESRKTDPDPKVADAVSRERPREIPADPEFGRL
jgi:hypothetical protein